MFYKRISETMANTVMIVFVIYATILLQSRTVLTQDNVNCNLELRASIVPLVIESANFPNHYPNNISCRTHITSPKGTVIELYFHAFNLEDSTNCEKDALVVFDGIDGGTRLLQHSCGSDFAWPHYPDKVVSTGNGMTLEFITDGSGTSDGYSATYQAVDPRPFAFIIANPDDQRLRVLDRHGARNFAFSSVDIRFPLAVDYDPISEFIFYSDKDARTIGRVNIVSLQSKILHSKDINYPFGLRLDVVSRLLYWIDADLGTVSVSDLEGNYRLTIIQNAGLDRPGSIVTEPHQGYIYFTDHGHRGKIWKAEADGSNLEILVSKSDFRPQGLAIDLQERCLYWVDTTTAELQMITVDGNNSFTFKLYDGVDPFAIALDGAAIFFTDNSLGALRFYERSLAMDGRGILFVGVSEYRGLTLRPLHDFGDEDPYACSSSPCDELCLPRPRNLFTCQKDHHPTDVFENCPDPILKWVAAEQTSTTVTWDAIQLVTLNYKIVFRTETPGNRFYLGTEKVSVLAIGPSNHRAWCNFTVSVQVDNEPPEITGCPSTITSTVSSGSTSVEVTWIEPTVSDNSGSVYWESTPAQPGATFRIGVTNLTYVARDGYGNTATCLFHISISAADDGEEVSTTEPPGINPYVVIPLCVAIPCLLFTLVGFAHIIQRYRRSRRMTHGHSHPEEYPQQMVPPETRAVSGRPLTFISGGAVNFQASPGLDNTYDVIIDNTYSARGPPPPYREKH